ncbi:TPA: hypothetical protein ACQRG4_002762 [Pseudomonas aeruginosa]
MSELNKESVEQAGGDERAAFEAYRDRRNALLESEGHKPGSKWHVTNAHYPTWEASRAALAQPSSVRSSLLINGYQLRAALDFIAPDGTAEQLKSEACIEWRQQDADFLEAGLYAFCAEYPEEGGVLLDEEPTTAQPSPLQSEQAEAERPEVVARVVHSNPVVLGQCGPLNANDELMTVAQHAASVARWAEMFNRVEQQRDVALARVAELEGKLTDWVHEGFRLNEALAMASDAASKGEAARQQCGGMEMEIEELRAELAELRARVVVLPEPLNEVDARRECGEYGAAMQRGYNACLRELARINGMTVSEGLVRRLCEPLLSHADYVVARNELRALFNEDKENGNG